MADATKFRHNIKHQPNQLVALEWLIKPLNEQFDELHIHLNQMPLPDIAKQYQKIFGVLTMANVPCFAKLADTLVQVANDSQHTLANKTHLIFCASKLLQYELNHYVLTGFLHETLLNLRVHFLQTKLGTCPDDSLATALFSDKIPLSLQTLSLPDFEKIGQAWYALINPLGQAHLDDFQTKFVCLKEHILATAAQQENAILDKLWALAVLWLTDLPNNSQADFFVDCLFDDLYRAVLLHKAHQPLHQEDVLWLDTILADLYIDLAAFGQSNDDTQCLLECLADYYLAEKAFFVYVVSVLETVSLDSPTALLDLQVLKDNLTSHGWQLYAKSLDVLMGDMAQKVSTDILEIQKKQLCQSLMAIHTLLDPNSHTVLAKSYEWLETAKRQLTHYLRTKAVGELPQADAFYQLSYAFEEMGLSQIATLYQRQADVFICLSQKAPKRISWQLAHGIADGLLLFELFLDGLSRQIFDHTILVQSYQCLDETLALIEALVEEVDEIFDIYARLLKAHENLVLYDDGGVHEPVVAEVVDAYLATPQKTQTNDDIEEACITQEIAVSSSTPVQVSTANTPKNPTPQTLMSDGHQSQNIFLTDILSIPNLSLSQSLQTHNDIKAAAAYAMTGHHSPPPDDSEALIEELLSKGLLEGVSGEPSGSVPPKIAEPLSVYKEFIEEFNQVNDNPQDDMQNQELVSDKIDTTGEVYLAVKAKLKDDDFSYDDEFREIFVEEAQEVMQELNQVLPFWQADNADFEALQQIRRHFHTLKGSGRMVGAFLVGETAWAIENLLNRVLDKSVAVTQDVVNLVGQAAHTLSVMVQDFSQKQPPSVDNVPLIVAAESLLAGEHIQQAQNECAVITSQLPAQEPISPQAMSISPNQIELPDVLTPFMEAASQPLVSIFEDVDEDIKEIFVEEAGEILTQIIPTFVLWQKDHTQKELLVEIRRGFHSLKGSGRMVGALELGELAWSVENMLNRVLDDSIAISDAMCVLIHDILADFGHLVELFKANVKQYPEQVILWTACANAYSKGLGDEFDYRIFSSFAKDGGMDWLLENPSEPSAQEPEPTCQSMQALGFIQEAEAIILNATPQTPHDEEEEMLCQIFVEEGRELLADVKAFLQTNQHAESVPVSDKIVRAFHTLRGASGLSALALVGEVGAIIEHGLQSLQQHDAPMGRTHLQALGNAVELIEVHLTAYESDIDELVLEDVQDLASGKQVLETLLSDASQDDISDIGVLIDGIDTLLDAELELETIMGQQANQIVVYAQTQLKEIALLTARTPSLPKFQMVLSALSSAYELIAKYPDCIANDDLVNALLATHHELVGLFDSLAGSMSLKVDEHVLENLVAQKVNYLTQDIQIPAVKSEPKAVSKTVILEELQTEYVNTDDELLEIFLTQAKETLAAIGVDIKKWQDDLPNLDHSKSIQRALEALSGGASLAGVSSICQIADVLCVITQRLCAKTLSMSRDWLDAIEQVYDVLCLQIETIEQSKQSFFVQSTIEDLQRHLLAGSLPKGVSIYTPVIQVETQAIQDEDIESVLVQDTVAVPHEEAVDFEKFIKESWHGVLPDKDILEIFLEEAKDLAESSSEDFAVFRNNTSDIETLQALQRKLHTIKGGARMVSANGVADLAHEMETIYEDLGNHRYPANQTAVSLLFACHDWIVSAIHLLSSHYNPPRPTLLIDALHQFIQSPDSVVAVPSVSLENEAQIIARYHEMADKPVQARDIAQMPPNKGVFGEKSEQNTHAEMIRISAPLMEQMINLSGETAINRARIDMSVVGLTASIEEMGVTVQRLADQLRRMDIELEAQILAQIDDAEKLDAGFDPLEMDQYSSLNQLSKSLSESASDLLDIKTTLLDKTRSSESLLLQLSRTQTQLQDKLMGSRMVPFSRLTPRLHRIVRQTANELGKMVELTVVNADGEVDRTILEHITSPLEHMLRNAVDHGIEFPEQRSELGKSTTGHIVLQVQREGNELVVVLSDDGAGINVGAVRQKIIKQGLIRPDDAISDNDVMQYIFNAGLSTANKVTQISGRGVGMDVVRSEIRQLGGAVSVESSVGKGSRFIIRVPLVVALSDVLVVRVADRQYAIPLVQIERVVQMSTKQLLAYYQSGDFSMMMDNQPYRLRYLNEILANHDFNGETLENSVPVVIAKSQVGSFALQVDEIVGSRMEVVAKPLGNQLARLSGISAATIMGDGSVMLILDLPALMRTPQLLKASAIADKQNQRHLIMVVDDSVTVRKVTSRFLERQGFDVVVAKDGVHAIEILQETVPDLMLLDIEMPRMDGFEVATQVRHSQRLKEIPIIMITSRTGEKHRKRAFEIGVNAYLGKPFQEMQLLSHISSLLD